MMVRIFSFVSLFFLAVSSFTVEANHPDETSQSFYQQVTTLSLYWMRPAVEVNDPTVELIKSQLAEFEAENPTIKVELTILDWASGPDAIRQAVADGNPPDIAMLGGRQVPGFVADGLIEPLDRYLTRDFRQRFVPAIIDEGAIYQGRTFGLPVAASTRALFYNQDLFEQAGIENAPQTWEELLAAGQAINNLGDETYGFGLQGGGGVETNTYFYYFLWGNGGDLYNASQTQSALNSPASVEALTFVQSLISENATQPNPDDIAYERRRSLEDMFQAGKLGMVISGPWFINRLRNEAPNINFAIAQLPYNTTSATYGVVDSLVMLSTSRQKETAWQLLEFLYTPEHHLAYVQQEGILPVLSEVADSPVLTDDPDFAMFLSLLPSARFEPLHVQSEAIAQIVITNLQGVYRGELTPEAALEQATSEINALLTVEVAGW